MQGLCDPGQLSAAAPAPSGSGSGHPAAATDAPASSVVHPSGPVVAVLSALSENHAVNTCTHFQKPNLVLLEG